MLGAGTYHYADAGMTANRGAIVVIDTPVPTVEPGDLVITEIYSNAPSADANKEWFEVYNTTGQPIDINGLIFKYNTSPPYTFTSGTIMPGTYAVFGQSDVLADNGGVDVDFTYPSSIVMGNSNNGALVLERGDGTVIASLDYSSMPFSTAMKFPEEGESLQLGIAPNTFNMTNVIDPASWCLSTTPWVTNGTELGSPGAANTSCNPPPTGGACLLFSEVVEGSASNKGFELFNCGTAPVDLSAYKVCQVNNASTCLLYTSPSPRDRTRSRMPSSA